MAENIKNSKRRLFVGEVVSDKMDKTVTVKTQRTFTDPKFHKIMRKNVRYKVHDPEGKAQLGDLIEFYEGRPVSKTKYMYLSRVIQSSSSV